jgi:glycerophosphoryl diester phosphodiesterase
MAPFPLGGLPKVIGHRGAATYAPENTLASFRRARELGVSWVEFDVRLTVLHDDTIDRTTDGSGAAGEMLLEEIAAYDAGSWFDAGFAGERIPTFEETIDLLEELGLGANIEIKPDAGVAVETAEAVCQILKTMWPAALPTPLISSFVYEAVETAYRAAPALPRAMLFTTVPDDWRGIAEAIEATTINCDHARLTPTRAKEIRAAGYPLLAYTVNHGGRAQELFGWGVSAVFTDTPDQVLRVV